MMMSREERERRKRGGESMKRGINSNSISK
jgi:hypothetical protein